MALLSLGLEQGIPTHPVPLQRQKSFPTGGASVSQKVAAETVAGEAAAAETTAGEGMAADAMAGTAAKAAAVMKDAHIANVALLRIQLIRVTRAMLGNVRIHCS